MEMSDKAVSTEEFVNEFELDRNHTLEVVRLGAVLNALIGSKVEAIKHEKKSSSVNSSPKSIIHRLRLTSTSTVSSITTKTIENELVKRRKYRKKQERKNAQNYSLEERHHQDLSISSPESQKILPKSSLKCQSPPFSDEDPAYQYGDKHKGFSSNTQSCSCCKKDNAQLKMHFDDDYVSLKIDEYDFEDPILVEEALRRARRKRRKKRRQRFKRQLALNAAGILPSDVKIKVLDPDELPSRARWTIVATACLLLLMCLLLVGITLRMAPLIDDMVRKENEELMNSLHRKSDNLRNKTNTSVLLSKT